MEAHTWRPVIPYNNEIVVRKFTKQHPKGGIPRSPAVSITRGYIAFLHGGEKIFCAPEPPPAVMPAVWYFEDARFLGPYSTATPYSVPINCHDVLLAGSTTRVC